MQYPLFNFCEVGQTSCNHAEEEENTFSIDKKRNQYMQQHAEEYKDTFRRFWPLHSRSGKNWKNKYSQIFSNILSEIKQIGLAPILPNTKHQIKGNNHT